MVGYRLTSYGPPIINKCSGRRRMADLARLLPGCADAISADSLFARGTATAWSELENPFVSRARDGMRRNLRRPDMHAGGDRQARR
jgi:hypothetical protein